MYNLTVNKGGHYAEVWFMEYIPHSFPITTMSVCDLIGHDVGQYYRKQKSCKFGCTFQSSEDPVMNLEMYVSVLK